MSARSGTEPEGKPVDLLDAMEQRTGGTGFIRGTLSYVFPDHWSFLLGEIALYSFVVLVATGTFLALFFNADLSETVYDGSYAPLVGHTMSRAYESSLSLSFDVDGGLLVRQTHHWAALVFVAAIVMHLMRIFFTGAFRKPRDINYFVGLTMLVLAIVEGYAGYSLLDDLLSGMGLAIGYGTALSIPVVGGDLATVIWGGQFPGSDAFISRLFIAHVFILPAVIAALIALHLLLVARPHHTQFRGPGRTESNVVGTPLWPAYALRSIGLLFATAAVLVLLGGLVQINPVWLWGPYETFQATNGAQPDWYLGWLIGALRITPGFDVTIGDYTLIPNPFFGGILFPAGVFAFLYLWPWLERLVTRDHAQHNLLDRPRDAPGRSAAGAALFTLVATVFFAGAADRAFVQVGIGYSTQVWIYRGLTVLGPIVAFFVTRRVCRRLRDSEASPTRPSRTVVRRNREGGFTAS
jgi:ubiquinol-cytochrome c reductase cytochrome b subunit